MLGTSRVVAATLASVLLLGPAWAQPTAAQKQQIQDLIKQAIAKSQAGDHAAAIEIYQKAYAVSPLPTLLSNIGAEYQLETKPVEALKYFCMYLEKDPAGPLASYATGQAKLLQSQLTSTTVEEKDVCKAPAPQPPPQQPGDQTGGTRDLGSTTGPAADPGKTLKTTGMILGGVGVVSVGLGIVFGVQAKKISDDISDHTDTTVPWRKDIVAYQDRGQRDEYLQITGLVLGGALIATGAVLYVKGRSKSSSAESTTLQPTVGANGGGLSLSGSF